MFGLLAGRLKSNLEIPPQVSRFLSLYLLMALGLKGGFALTESGLTSDVAISLAQPAMPGSTCRWQIVAAPRRACP